jgi:hypothetical protein
VVNKRLKIVLTALIFVIGSSASTLLLHAAFGAGDLAFSFIVVGLLVGILGGVLTADFWMESGAFASFFQYLNRRKGRRGGFDE